ncbi:hypothetical protein [Pedobacter paludis]|uniref:Uncharacterized protein n=1 Tax=Pedobacter paludis TaxID=2203212 RepID=A0A317EVR0_9SPHI|nr:hypothetical protein [Pedobacter paludis]PWS30043.1 hypothetical protein DF947_18925 [Pedobacter paludis]
MEQILNWSKGTFDSNYHVLKDGLLRFSLNFSSLKNSAIATTQSGIFLLKSTGIANPETLLFNNKNEVLAKITYDLLGFKAKIIFKSGEQFDWSFQNSWLSRWSLNNHTDKQILFSASSGRGMINSNVDDDMLVFCGLFIREYFARILFGFIIVVFILLTGKGIF